MEHQSPVAKFPGTVVLPEYLTMPQVLAFETALGKLTADLPEDGQRVWLSIGDRQMLSAVLPVVTEWRITGVPESPTAETFPFTPRKASHDLIQWLFNLIRDIWIGEDQIPNA